MHSLTYRDNQVEPGLPLEAMAAAFEAMGNESPGKTLSSVATHMLLYWDPSMGKGQITVQPEDGKTEFLPMPHRPRGSRSRPEAVLAASPCVLRLSPETGSGLTINVSASGAYTVAEGADSLPEPVLADEPGQSELQRQGRAWLRNGRVGASSYALCVALAGVEDPQRTPPKPTETPLDFADFQRCQAFFMSVPGARALLPRMVEQGPYWAALVPIWEKLEGMSNSGDGPGVHAAIREAMSAIQSQGMKGWWGGPGNIRR